MRTFLEHSIVSDCIRPERPVRAAIYVRISSDPSGKGLGVARQEEDCRVLCERLGWDAVLVYCDNDVSAYSGKPRPQWNQLLADITAGLIDAVACWHVDRLTRSPRELEEVIDLHDKRGILLATVTGELDLSTPTGRMLARMLGAAARHEAEHKAERQQRAGLQKARAGQPHPAGRRGYGYQADGVTIIGAEAEIVREARTRVLAGESVRSVAGDLDDRAVPTVTGARWSTEALRQILVSGRISGRREYHGEIMTGQPSWSAIITVAESDQLRAHLARRPGTPRGRARSYLFSGIFTCGTCQAGLYGRPHSAGPRYVCVKEPGKPGCGKVTVMAGHAEQIARDKILTALDSPDFITALITATSTAGDTDTVGISAQLREIDAQREELAADWATRRITRKEWLAARDSLTAEADRLTARLSRSEHSRALVSFAAMTGTVWERWEQMTGGARRALIKAATAAIPVHPATSRRWEPNRIGAPVWRA
jgi:DNA invertase Pin-like site-specific DNA recombinase